VRVVREGNRGLFGYHIAPFLTLSDSNNRNRPPNLPTVRMLMEKTRTTDQSCKLLLEKSSVVFAFCLVEFHRSSKPSAQLGSPLHRTFEVLDLTLSRAFRLALNDCVGSSFEVVDVNRGHCQEMIYMNMLGLSVTSSTADCLGHCGIKSSLGILPRSVIWLEEYDVISNSKVAMIKSANSCIVKFRLLTFQTRLHHRY